MTRDKQFKKQVHRLRQPGEPYAAARERIRKEQERGSTDAAQPVRPSSDDGLSPIRGSQVRLLLCEHDPALRRALSRLLSTSFDVVATDGAEGVARLATESFDVVLTDLLMPAPNGFAVLEAVRRSGQTTPVVVMTGAPNLQDATRAMRLGASDFLIKPFDAPEIRKALQEVLLGHRSRIRDSFGVLWDKRHFSSDLELQLRSHHFPVPFSVLILDVDRLKSVNNALGHVAADDVLREIFRVLGDRVSPHLAYRLGGDEAGAILPGLDLDEARSIAEAIRAAVQTKFASTLLEGGSTPTVSIGVGCIRSRASGRALYSSVDDLARKAKTRKNSVEGATLAFDDAPTAIHG
jgi:diguanylate cyclase (GGDEF)-like protein